MDGDGSRLAFLGFGEAAMAFAPACRARSGHQVRAFDIKTDNPATASAIAADYADHGVEGAANSADALAGADLVLSLVTADRALAAARSAAPALARGALYCDMNSVSPGTKRQAAKAVEDTGARYADVAIMAPVHPRAENVPLLVSGPHAETTLAALADFGFGDITPVGDRVGRASTIKMIRSIMVKGLESLAAECLIAAHRAGVTDQVIWSLTGGGDDWRERGDYALDRMMAHGGRRAAEMAEVIRTLGELDLGGTMAEASRSWQQVIGALDLGPVAGLAGKIAQIEDACEAKGVRLP